METELKLQHTWHDKYSDQDETVELALKVAIPPGNNNEVTNQPGFVWLGGFKSDMTGTKAAAMVEQAARMGSSSLRFDYSGHGESGGEFINGTISRWVDESIAVFLARTTGPQILIGSSMGGWIALRLAQQLNKRGLADRLAGLLLIAPAPDFTRDLMEAQFTEQQRADLEVQGYIEEHSEYSDEPNIITRKLIEDGRDNLVMETDLSIGAPIRILQGMQDPDVPYQHALKLVEVLAHDDVAITLIKGGDHRLSRDEDIATLHRTMQAMFTR